MIANGSLVTYEGTWPTGGIIANALTGKEPSTIVTRVANDLTAAGLAVRNSQTNIPLVGASYTVTFTIQINNGVGYGALDDIISIVRHYVYQEIGLFPISDSIPYVQVPASAPVTTGQPTQIGSPTPTAGAPATSTWDTVKSWFSSAATGSTWLLAAVGLGFVGAVILIAKKE